MVPPETLVTPMISGFQSLQRCMSVNTPQTSCDVALISIADETRIGTGERARSNEINVRKGGYASSLQGMANVVTNGNLVDGER